MSAAEEEEEKIITFKDLVSTDLYTRKFEIKSKY